MNSGSKTPIANPSKAPPTAPKQERSGSFAFPAGRVNEESKEDTFDDSEWDKELTRRAQTEVN